jgi:hypothetical protein
VDKDELAEQLFRIVRRAVADLAHEHDLDVCIDHSELVVTVGIDRKAHNRYASGVDRVTVKVETETVY